MAGHPRTSEPGSSIPSQASARILIVCTANQCRSPMAERLLQRALHRRGAAAQVCSAGLLSDGRPADVEAVRAARRLGLDLSSHVSRRLSPELLEAHDLAVTMERRHVHAAVDLLPSAWPRTFTLADVLARGARRPARQPDEDLTAWLARLHEGRRPSDVLRGGLGGDVPDPVGRGPAAFRRTADELAAATEALAALMFPGHEPMTTDMDDESPHAQRRWSFLRRQ